MLSKIINYFWTRNNIINRLLSILSLVWLIASKIRNKLAEQYHSSLFIICIGNITAGGSGKTPTTIAVTNILKKQGYKVAILGKGYKGQIKEPTWVTRHQTYKQVGDEALILRQHAPTLVSKNLKSGVMEVERYNFDILILDDGLQNPYVFKNYNILVIDGDFGIGNGRLIPAGPLRESITSGVQKASSMLIIGNDKHQLASYARRLRKPVFLGYHKNLSGEHIQNSPYLAFCGIARPKKFLNVLKQSNYDIKELIEFPDHYAYSIKNINELIKKAHKLGLKLITTEKDFCKIPPQYHYLIEVAHMAITINNEQGLLENITYHYQQKKLYTLQ